METSTPKISEIVGTNTQGPDSVSQDFLVENVATAAAARSFAAGEVDLVVGTLTDRSITSTDLEDPTKFRISVTWSEEEDEEVAQEIGFRQDSFTVVPARRHVYTSIRTASVVQVAGYTPPDFKGAVNVTPEREVLGVEWPPSDGPGWSTTRTVASSVVNQTYFRAVLATAGRVNSAPYEGFQAGELLFTGATGSRTLAASDSPWQITYNFLVSANAVSLQVTPELTIPSKVGWHFTWPWFRDVQDEEGMLVRRPAALYTEQIAVESGFGGLIQ